MTSASGLDTVRRSSLVEYWFAWIAASPAASAAVIVVVALACFLPGFVALGPLDGDEPGYAVAAREMVATGDFTSVRLQTDAAELAPRGGYWIQAFLVALAGGAPPIWVYRLPSLAGAVGACLFTWWTMLAFGRPRAALLSALFLAGAGVVCLEARQAAPDTLLLASITLSAGALARAWLDRRPPSRDLTAALFWLGLGVGILMKGIVAPAVIAVAILILSIERGESEWIRRLRPAAGLAGLFVIVSPFLIALLLSATQGTAGGPSVEFLGRIGVPFSLNAPPGTYTLLVPLLSGPAVTYLFLGLRGTMEGARRPVILFALALGAPLWFAAELVTAKNPQNILPALPSIAILAAVAVDSGTARITGWISWFYSLGPLIWPPLIAIVFPLIFYFLEGFFPWPAFAAFVVAALLGPVAWIWLRRDRMVASAALSVVAVIFIYAGFFGGMLPHFQSLRVAETVAAVPVPCGDADYAVAGYPEESTVLALGRGTRIVEAWGAADFLNSAGCRVAVVDRSSLSSFRQRIDDLGLVVVDRARISGFNLRKMRFVDVHLFITGSNAG